MPAHTARSACSCLSAASCALSDLDCPYQVFLRSQSSPSRSYTIDADAGADAAAAADGGGEAPKGERSTATTRDDILRPPSLLQLCPTPLALGASEALCLRRTAQRDRREEKATRRRSEQTDTRKDAAPGRKRGSPVPEV